MRALDKFKDRFLDIAEDLMPDGELKGREYWHRCPFHDDKTPSFSINIEKGTYHCFGCGASGDIISLYAKTNDIDDSEAIKNMKDKYLNKPHARDTAGKPKENDLYKKQKAVQQMQYIWDSAESEAEIVKRYLKGRGIYGVNSLPDNLRFSKEHNAMIAKVVDKNSNLRAIHKTILQKTDGKVKRGEKLFEKNSQAKGCAVHFGKPTDVLGVAEGIETALSVKEALPDLPMWAALSASFMDSLDIPDTVKKLYIFYDKDKSGAGRKAATKLATRYAPEGVEIYLVEPPMGIPSDSKGVDFNDVLLAQGKDAIVAAYRKAVLYGNDDKGGENPKSDKDTTNKLDFDMLDVAKNYIKKQPLYYDRSNTWWSWNGSQWEMTDETDILGNITLKQGYTKAISKNIKDTLFTALKVVARVNKPKDLNSDYLQFKDCLYDLKTNKIIEPDPAYFITSSIPWKLGNGKDTPTIDRLFESWQPNNKELLYEIAAFCFLPSYAIHKIFILLGDGANGKSKLSPLSRQISISFKWMSFIMLPALRPLS